MTIELRSLTIADQPVLWEFLFHAIYTLEGEEKPTREILNNPEIAHYADSWGSRGDRGFMAIKEGIPVGAAWLRFIKGYGYVSDDIPEMTIAVLPDHRGEGIGTLLLKKLIDTSQDLRGISLSVVGENPAMKLYERFGFQIVAPDGASYTMLLRIKNDK